MVDIYFDKLTCNNMFHKLANEFIQKNNLAFYENSRGTGTYYLDDADNAPSYLSMPLKSNYNVLFNINIFNKVEYFTWLRIMPEHQVGLAHYLYMHMPVSLHQALHENLSKILCPESIASALQEQHTILAYYLQTPQSKKGCLWTTEQYYTHLLYIFKNIEPQERAAILKKFMIANNDYFQTPSSQKKMLAFIQQYIEPQYQALCSDLLDAQLVNEEKITDFACVSTALNYTIEIDKNQLMANIKNIDSKTQLNKFTKDMVKNFVSLLQDKRIVNELGLLNVMLCVKGKSDKNYYISVYHKPNGISSEKLLLLLTAFVSFYKEHYDPTKVVVALSKSNTKSILLKWYLHYSLQQQLPVNDIKKGVVKI